MRREKVIHLLNQNQKALRNGGISHLYLFGSYARDEATETSDIDILIELNKPIGLFQLMNLQDRLQQLLDRPVDLGTIDGIKDRLKLTVDAEIIHVF
jgi:predicted nucleotidyltransferase